MATIEFVQTPVVGALGGSGKPAYRGSESMIVFMPRGGTGGRAPIVHCHGYALTVGQIWPSYLTDTLAGDDLRSIADAGHPVLVPELDGNSTWGRDGQWQAIDNAITWAATHLGTVTTRVGLTGESMGALGALNNAYRNPARTRAVALKVPVVNLAEFRTRNEATFGALVDAAWGNNAAYLAGLPTHDPSAQALVDVLKTIGHRMLLQYTTADEYVTVSEVATFATKVGATMLGYPGDHAAGFTLPVRDMGEWVVQRLGA